MEGSGLIVMGCGMQYSNDSCRLSRFPFLGGLLMQLEDLKHQDYCLGRDDGVSVAASDGRTNKTRPLVLASRTRPVVLDPRSIVSTGEEESLASW